MSVLFNMLVSVPSNMDDLVRANLEASEEDKLPEAELVGQVKYTPLVFYNP